MFNLYTFSNIYQHSLHDPNHNSTTFTLSTVTLMNQIITNFRLLDNLDPFLSSISHIYEVGSGIISIFVILWFLNFLAGLIRNTYAAGHSLGAFYRTYIHRYLKPLFLSLINNFRKRRTNLEESAKDPVKLSNGL